MSDLISVIVPAFEKEKQIRACLNSIIGQTYKNLEIIIVFRPGDDKTLDIIKTFPDERIKLLIQTQNNGAGGARNMGLAAASGAYIGFVDCDDCLPPDFYAKLHSAILSSNADIAWGEIMLCTSGKHRLISSHSHCEELTDFAKAYSKLENGAVFDKLFVADFIRSNFLFFPENITYEDNPFLLKAFYFARKIVTIHKAVYFYNISSKTAAYIEKLKMDAPKAAALMADFAEQQQFSPQLKKLLQQQILKHFAGAYIGDSTVYQKLKSIFGFSCVLNKTRWNWRLKQWRRWLFQCSLRKKYLVVFGLHLIKSKER